jgi:hypothetical protein
MNGGRNNTLAYSVRRKLSGSRLIKWFARYGIIAASLR